MNLTTTTAALAPILRALAEEHRDMAAGLEAQGKRGGFWRMRAAYAERAADLASPAAAWWEDDALCVASQSEPGAVRRVGATGCDCPAGAGRRWCYHREIRCAAERLPAALGEARDADAEIDDDPELAGLLAAPAPLDGDWYAAEHAAQLAA